jgi:lysozyme family protein
MTLREAAAQFTLNKEARRDAKGRLRIYPLPSGDGGGKWEVAGVCERYHPREAAQLAALVKAGKFEEAERVAQEHYADYTDVIAKWPVPDGAEFFLRDTAYNRGAGGAATILQYAVGAVPDGQVGPATGKAVMTFLATKSEQDLIHSLHSASERYERAIVKRGPSSKFWKGLVSRWKDRRDASLAWIAAARK